MRINIDCAGRRAERFRYGSNDGTGNVFSDIAAVIQRYKIRVADCFNCDDISLGLKRTFETTMHDNTHKAS
jgi:hypothetical protein